MEKKEIGYFRLCEQIQHTDIERVERRVRGDEIKDRDGKSPTGYYIDLVVREQHGILSLVMLVGDRRDFSAPS